MRTIRFVASFILVAIFILGCGGSGDSTPSNRGRLRVSIHWPSGRDIPPAAQSLKVTAVTLIQNESGQKVEDAEVGKKVVARPQGQATSDITLEDLPSVEVRVKVSAYASTDGSGTALALGTGDIQIPENGTANASITLHADIASIEPDPFDIEMLLNENRSIFMIPRLSDGTQTTIDESRWSFLSLQPGIATVTKRASPNGHIADVHALSRGTTAIQIRDSGTGLTVQVPVTVE